MSPNPVELEPDGYSTPTPLDGCARGVTLAKLEAPGTTATRAQSFRPVWAKLALELSALPHLLGVMKACAGFRTLGRGAPAGFSAAPSRSS